MFAVEQLITNLSLYSEKGINRDAITNVACKIRHCSYACQNSINTHVALCSGDVMGLDWLALVRGGKEDFLTTCV
jgi:hypothetical protein